jgi:hypothetical protein
MRSLMRTVCISYLVFLTILLLSKDPARWVGMSQGFPWLLRIMLPSAHFLSFFVLAVMVLCTRWPMPRWGIVPGLMLYAGMTEIMQGLFPPRTPEWMDWFQDVSGIAVGAMLCWAVALAARRLSKPWRNPSRLSSEPAEEWETLQKIVHRSVAVEPSWWG